RREIGRSAAVPGRSCRPSPPACWPAPTPHDFPPYPSSISELGTIEVIIAGEPIWCQPGAWCDCAMIPNKRGEILREQVDQIRAAVSHQFAGSCAHVQRIVADAVPGRSPDREKAEWRAV